MFQGEKQRKRSEKGHHAKGWSLEVEVAKEKWPRSWKNTL